MNISSDTLEIRIADRSHPRQDSASRINRQKARILLRWNAAGHAVTPFRLSNACRSLRVSGLDRAPLTLGKLRPTCFA